MEGRISDPGMQYPPRVELAPQTPANQQSAISQWDWVFHTVRGGIDPGDRRVRPRCVGLGDVLKDF